MSLVGHSKKTIFDSGGNMKRILISLLTVMALAITLFPTPIAVAAPPSGTKISITIDPSMGANIFIWDEDTDDYALDLDNPPWKVDGTNHTTPDTIYVTEGHCYTVWIEMGGFLYKIKSLTGGASTWCCVGNSEASGCVGTSGTYNVHFSSKEIATNNPPVADANGPYSDCVGVPITFDASGSLDPDGDTLEYRWDFEYDGSTPSFDTGWLSVQTTTHTYTSTGAYTVYLEVRDLYGGTPVGGTDFDTSSVTVIGDDDDGDGHYAPPCGNDCDDTNPDVNPDATEICDGQDNDCDGLVDCDDPDIPDTDGDGVCDCNDDCPDDPLKTVPGDCGCGVADTDSDGDGTPDCNDDCPDDPLKTVPGDCGCGVADTDSDGDGTPDCNDDCPDDPLKTVPGDCGCGVADTDSDGDGTPTADAV